MITPLGAKARFRPGVASRKRPGARVPQSVLRYRRATAPVSGPSVGKRAKSSRPPFLLADVLVPSWVRRQGALPFWRGKEFLVISPHHHVESITFPIGLRLLDPCQFATRNQRTPKS